MLSKVSLAVSYNVEASKRLLHRATMPLGPRPTMSERSYPNSIPRTSEIAAEVDYA